jgi:hypothetical protein
MYYVGRFLWNSNLKLIILAEFIFQIETKPWIENSHQPHCIIQADQPDKRSGGVSINDCDQ